MAKTIRRKPRGITAWLITWEHFGDHAVPPSHIAAILNYRWPGDRVRKEVELLYVNSSYSLAERIAYAKNKSLNPYPAEFNRINGIPLTSQIICGHNPFLYARLVDNLLAVENDLGEAQVTWNERPGPDPERLAKLLGKERVSE